jgi:hypothetical protein
MAGHLGGIALLSLAAYNANLACLLHSVCGALGESTVSITLERTGTTLSYQRLYRSVSQFHSLSGLAARMVWPLEKDVRKPDRLPLKRIVQQMVDTRLEPPEGYSRRLHEVGSLCWFY